MILKVKENLHLIAKSKPIKVVSYQTEVAEIVDGKIKSYGKFSRTTSKQMCYLSQILGMPLLASRSGGMPFDWLHYGAAIRFDGSISNKGSVIIAKQLKQQSLKGACAASWNLLKGKDREIILEHFKKDTQFMEMISLAELGIIFSDEEIDLSKIDI